MYHCTKTKKDEYNYNKIMNTTSTRVTVKKMVKDIRNMSNTFTMINTQLQKLKEADSNLSEYEYEYEASYFHISGTNFGKSNFQFA